MVHFSNSTKRNRRFLTWKPLFLSSIRQTWGAQAVVPAHVAGRSWLVCPLGDDSKLFAKGIDTTNIGSLVQKENPSCFYYTWRLFIVWGAFLLYQAGSVEWFAGSSSITWTRAMVSWVWSLVPIELGYDMGILTYHFFSKLTMSTEIVAGLTTSSFYAVHCQRHPAKSQPGWGIGKTFFRRKIVGALRGFTDVFLFHTGLERCYLGGPGDGKLPTVLFEDRYLRTLIRIEILKSLHRILCEICGEFASLFFFQVRDSGTGNCIIYIYVYVTIWLYNVN